MPEVEGNQRQTPQSQGALKKASNLRGRTLRSRAGAESRGSVLWSSEAIVVRASGVIVAHDAPETVSAHSEPFMSSLAVLRCRSLGRRCRMRSSAQWWCEVGQRGNWVSYWKKV